MLRPWDMHQNFGTDDPIARSSRAFEPSIGNWRALDRESQARLNDKLDTRENLPARGVV